MKNYRQKMNNSRLNAVKRDGDTWHVYVDGKWLSGFDTAQKAKAAFYNALIRDQRPAEAQSPTTSEE